MGTLTSEDGYVNLKTKEGRIPKDRQSYIKWCLPPGEYEFTVEYLAVSIGSKVIRGYWPSFLRVPWFPNAGLYTGTAFSAGKGRVMLGTDAPDEFHIEGDEEAAKVILRHCKKLHEADARAVHTLVVEHDENLEVHDYSIEDYERQLQILEEQREREQFMRELYGEDEETAENN